MKNNKTATESNKPAHEIRHGGLRVTIWGNQTEAGIRYNVTHEKSYKDGSNGKRRRPMAAPICWCWPGC